MPTELVASKTTPLNRYFINDWKDHFYTLKQIDVSTRSNWDAERTEGYVYKEQTAATVPLYRYFINDWKDHYYTIYPPEKTPLNWTYECIEGYVFTQARDHCVPFRRYFINDWNDHFYTIKPIDVSTRPNWKEERIEGYVYESDPDLIIAHFVLGDPVTKEITTITANEDNIENNADAELTTSFKWWEQTAQTESTDFSKSTNLSLKCGLSAKASLVVEIEANLEVGLELGFTQSHGFSITKSEGVEKSIEVKVKPRSKVRVTAKMARVKMDVPVTVTYVSGKVEKGTWRGQVASRADVKTEDMKLRS